MRITNIKILLANYSKTFNFDFSSKVDELDLRLLRAKKKKIEI